MPYVAGLKCEWCGREETRAALSKNEMNGFFAMGSKEFADWMTIDYKDVCPRCTEPLQKKYHKVKSEKETTCSECGHKV